VAAALARRRRAPRPARPSNPRTSARAAQTPRRCSSTSSRTATRPTSTGHGEVAGTRGGDGSLIRSAEPGHATSRSRRPTGPADRANILVPRTSTTRRKDAGAWPTRLAFAAAAWARRPRDQPARSAPNGSIAPENPLLARVTVNRFWQELFGIGLVESAEDFGIMGEAPAESGAARLAGCRVPRTDWDVKHLFRADGDLRHVPPERCRPRPRSWRKIRQTACSAAARASAWMPRWSATTRSPPAGCSVPKSRRTQREAVPARTACGSRWRCPRATPSSYQHGFGRRALPAQPLHLLEARRTAGRAWKCSTRPTGRPVRVRRERTDTPLQALVTHERPAVHRGGAARSPNQRSRTPAAIPPVRLVDEIARRLLARPLTRGRTQRQWKPR
jgi:hypothetical protein